MDGKNDPPRRLSTFAVGILIYDGVEVLDFCGPFEVFSVTRSDAIDVGLNKIPSPPPHLGASPPFQVMLVAESLQRPVTTTGGMNVLASVDFESCPSLDILIVPGGIGSRTERFNQATLNFIKQQHSSSLAVLASVCTGSLILSETGLLNGQRATTHWIALDLMEKEYPNVHVVRDKHWIKSEIATTTPETTTTSNEPSLLVRGTEQKYLFTSAGISAGIDMSLKIVEQLLGESVARKTARYMEYPFPESDERRVQA